MVNTRTSIDRSKQDHAIRGILLPKMAFAGSRLENFTSALMRLQRDRLQLRMNENVARLDALIARAKPAV